MILESLLLTVLANELCDISAENKNVPLSYCGRFLFMLSKHKNFYMFDSFPENTKHMGMFSMSIYKYCNHNICLEWKKRECPILLRHYLCHSSKINKLLLNFFIYSLSHKIQETLPKACRDKTRGNGFKQKEGWFRLGIRKKLFLQEWWGSGSGCPEDL